MMWEEAVLVQIHILPRNLPEGLRRTTIASVGKDGRRSKI